MTTSTYTPAELLTDLRTMVAAETPATEWVGDVEAMLSRPLTVTETRLLLHNLHGYQQEPWSELWRDGLARLARTLIAGTA